LAVGDVVTALVGASGDQRRLGNFVDGGSPIGGVAERQSVVAPDAGFIEA
jgi:hypothetical protein